MKNEETMPRTAAPLDEPTAVALLCAMEREVSGYSASQLMTYTLYNGHELAMGHKRHFHHYYVDKVPCQRRDALNALQGIMPIKTSLGDRVRQFLQKQQRSSLEQELERSSLEEEPAAEAFYWHVCEDTLLEALTAPLTERMAYLRTCPDAIFVSSIGGLLPDAYTKAPAALLEERIAHIRAQTPPHEIATRLRLLQPVRGQLPAAYVEAWTACNKARFAYNETYAAYVKAAEAYVKAREAYIETVYACACDGVWDACKKAWNACIEAWLPHTTAVSNIDKAYRALTQAEWTYDRVWNACKLEIEALHREECPDCPLEGRDGRPDQNRQSGASL